MVVAAVGEGVDRGGGGGGGDGDGGGGGGELATRRRIDVKKAVRFR